MIKNFSFSDDCLVAIDAFRKMGIKISKKKEERQGELIIYGKGLYGLKSSNVSLDMQESGTSFRLITGVLAGQRFNSCLKAAPSLTKRPMHRITKPLRLMGAEIRTENREQKTENREEYPPLIIKGARLKGIKYKLPIPSAQVKSCLLLAGLYAQGQTEILEPLKSRDHTERMLKLFKADIKLEDKRIKIKGGKELVSPRNINIPGDISSAAFFIVGALILPDSYLVIKNVGLNPTRLGLLKVLKRMGARISVYRLSSFVSRYEPIGDIVIKSSKLKGTVVKKEEIPSLIDELPILMVAGCFAKGKTIIEGVGELRVKETDRINSMVENLRKIGAKIQVKSKKSKVKSNRQEIIVIESQDKLTGARLNSFGDHRSAMSLIIAALAAKGKSIIDDISCIRKSFPNFLDVLSNITVDKNFN